jgi:hypothetical protein
MTRIPDSIAVAGPDTHCLVVAVPYDGEATVASNLPHAEAARVLRHLADQLDRPADKCGRALATGQPCPVHDATSPSRALLEAGREAAPAFARGMRAVHAERKRIADVLASFGAALADSVRAAGRGELEDVDRVTTVEEAAAHIDSYGADLRDPQQWTPPVVGMLEMYRRGLAAEQHVEEPPADAYAVWAALRGALTSGTPVASDEADRLISNYYRQTREQTRREDAARIAELGKARGWSIWAADYLHPDREFVDTGAPTAEEPTTPAEGEQYVKREAPDKGRVVTVKHVWAADDGHLAVSYSWDEPRVSYAGSACPLDVFHRTYAPATEQHTTP